MGESREQNAEKLAAKTEAFLALMSDKYGQIFPTLEDCYKFLSEKAKAIEFVYGKGKRKTPLQRNIEKLEEYLEGSEKYAECFKKFKGRKSYSKRHISSRKTTKQARKEPIRRINSELNIWNTTVKKTALSVRMAVN